jgi:hypothetical protein
MAGVAYDVGSWRLGDDGRIHRRGRVKFSNGDVYEGEWVDGTRHGKGTLRFANGSSYLGDFAHNAFHGFGLLTIKRTQHALTKKWIPGERYDGEFRHGKKHGRGTAKTAAGDTFDGEFEHGYYHGRGVCAYANGDVYDGQWARGKWHGHGELRRGRDGSVYVGGMATGLFHGYGTYAFGRGGSYAGDYRFGLRHGKGVRVFGDGSGKRYEGDWVDDVMEGVGLMECRDSKYVGEFQGGMFHGHGVLSYANGDSYEGRFVRGDLEGDGKYKYSDGGSYVGQFLASKRHGVGRRVFRTGDWYYGAWQHNRMQGRGLLERKATHGNDGAFSIYRYDGDFAAGEQTGRACISFVFTPANADDRFEWNDEYEFPEGSGLWHGGRGVSTYAGQVYRGAFHGHGELTSPDGRRWEGQWCNGRLHGDALCVYLPLVHEVLVDNDKLSLKAKKAWAIHVTKLYRMVRYDGAFVEGVRHGRGRVLFENGDSVSGEFANGATTGVVLYRFSTGKERFAEYASGQRVRWLSDHEELEIRAREAAEQAAQATEDGRRQSVLRAIIAGP